MDLKKQILVALGLDKETEVDLQKSFIRYNDTQDKHRKGKTWRELLPELEQALTINTN